MTLPNQIINVCIIHKRPSENGPVVQQLGDLKELQENFFFLFVGNTMDESRLIYTDRSNPVYLVRLLSIAHMGVVPI